MYKNHNLKAPVSPNLQPRTQQPARPTDFPTSGYRFEVTPPYEQGQLSNRRGPPSPPQSTSFMRPRVQSMQDLYPRTRPRPPAAPSAGHDRIAFPEPQLYRPSSGYFQDPSASPPRPSHRSSRSNPDRSQSPTNTFPKHGNPSVASFASSYNAHPDDDHYGSGSNEAYDDDAAEFVRGLSDSSLQSEEGLRHFQAGQLAENDQEWHRLVPPEAREALGKKEVQRQSVIFEIIKSERDYVADLQAVEQIFINRLRQASPTVIREPQLTEFILEVFGNLPEILSYHQRILAALFARQRDQHPLVQSIADIIFDTTLKSGFRDAYETYIKRYPLAESHHRKQLKKNRAYEGFIQSMSRDSRIRKRDLITFLSRPVTRLPRLNLLLEQVLKLTDTEHSHPDLETLPLILSILKDCIKSTQPGIEAAENKVKFWALCESLVFQKGEIIDMDLYDESRSLVYFGPVLRRAKSETGLSSGAWIDLNAALLDNYFVLTREEKKPNGPVRRLLMSRPLPLSFLRLGSFDSPPETRREKADDGKLLETFRYHNVPIYPFTIYHAANRSTRKYTLYVTNEALRKKWYDFFVDAIGVHKVRQEANMWFNPQTVTDGFFRVQSKETDPPAKANGRVNCAVPFVHAKQRFIAVGSSAGIFVARQSSEHFKLVLNIRNATSLAALGSHGNKQFNRFVVHHDSSLVSYSLDLVARTASGQSRGEALEASIERLGANDSNIVFFRHVHLAERSLLIYSSKRRLSSSMNIHALEAIDSSELTLSPSRPVAIEMHHFRTYGEPGYVPKDAYDVIALSKLIGISTSAGIVIADPTDLAHSTIMVVPNMQSSGSDDSMATLKTRIEGKKPLGLIRVDPTELLVVYDELGCYIDKYGTPRRNCGYVKWEAKATSYAHRRGLVLLFSPEFIEIRSITTGRIVQVIVGRDIRLLYSGPYVDKDYPILVAMRGGKNGQDGVSDKISELTETEEINPVSPTSENFPAAVWDEWDM